MNLERFKILIDVLKHVKPEEFNMRDWQCGTAACAGGHLAMDKRANDLGFTMAPLIPTSSYEVPSFKGRIGYDALKRFFNITDFEVEYLFAHYSYKGFNAKPSTVLRRVRKFIKDGGAVE